MKKEIHKIELSSLSVFKRSALFGCRVLFGFILIVGFIFSNVAEAQHTVDLQVFESATQSYFTNDYKKAATGFKRLAEENPNNGYLHYNLGNAYFKQGQLGESIQQYHKAMLLIPREADLSVNLDLVTSKLSDNIEKSFSDYLAVTFYSFWSSKLTLSEYGLMLALFSFLFWMMSLILLWKGKFRFRLRWVLSFLLLIYLAGGYHLKSDLETKGRYGIVLDPEVSVKAIYMDKDKSLFQVHEGTRVKIIDSQSFGQGQNWLRIQLPAGPKGWVKSLEIGVI